MMERKPDYEIKKILLGAGIILCLYSIPLIIPFFGSICAVFTPLPVFYYRLKLGRITSSVLLGAVILFILTGNDLFYSIIFFWLIILGFLLGELTEARLSLERIITGTCIGGALSALFFIYTYSRTAHRSIFESVSVFVKKNLNLILKIYTEAGMYESEIELFASSMDRLEFVIVRIMPGVILSCTLIISVITLLSARRIFEKKIRFSDFGNLNIWKADESFVWYLIISCGSLLLPIGNWKLIGVNALIVLINIYFFQGTAILSYYFEKKKIISVVKWLLFTIIISQKYLLLMLITAGFFDTWINFRRIKDDV